MNLVCSTSPNPAFHVTGVSAAPPVHLTVPAEKRKHVLGLSGEQNIIKTLSRHYLSHATSQRLRTNMPNGKDDERYESDEEAEDLRRTSEGSNFSFEHIEICPLEAQCNPKLDGNFDKQAVLTRIAKLSPVELCKLSELCMCVKGCKYRKCVDSDAAWWPHCAAAWYEPGMVRSRRESTAHFFSWCLEKKTSS